MAKVTFNNKNAQFYKSAKKSVDDYFKANGLKKTGNWRLYLKAAVLMPLAVAIYVYLLLGDYHWAAGLVLALLLGASMVCIAFNVMHDACHGSYSRRKWVNEVMGYTMNALGANAFIWKIKHNIVHHTYTNIEGIDDDISNGPLLRLSDHQKWRPVHRYQYIYMYLLYSISTIAWMFGTDFYKYFARKINTTKINRIDLKEHIIFWVSKLLYVFFYVALPIYFLGWQAWMVGFLLVQATMGLTLSVVFQLAHMVEDTTFDTVEEHDKVIEHEWAVHELKTTANFAANNKVISWLFGGLNFQIEHHLFPHISHIHYPALSKIVREQCQQFDLPYNNYTTMGDAVVSHIKQMKALGRKPSEN